jgi:hypothetical protein
MCVLSKPGRIAIMMLMVLSLLSCRMPRAPGPRPTLEKGFGSPLSTPPPPTLPTSPCLPPPDISSGETPSPLLDLRDLRWEELARPDRRLRHLPGSPYPIFPESISQDGRRLTVVWRWPLEPPLQNAGFLASAELDTEGNTHHWLIQDGSAIREKETVEEVCCWTLSDGRRLRATRTHVGLIRLILEEDHRSRVLEPPEPIRDLLLARDAVALASSPNGTVWRVDLNTGTWEKVLERERGLWGVIMARDSAYGWRCKRWKPRMGCRGSGSGKSPPAWARQPAGSICRFTSLDQTTRTSHRPGRSETVLTGSSGCPTMHSGRASFWTSTPAGW